MKIIDKLKDFGIDKNIVIGVVATSVSAFCLMTYGEKYGRKDSEGMIDRLKGYNDELHMQNIELLNQINKLQDAQ